ncbi:MAG TPA: sigma-70 family RNA polymerase sigma factor [Planctomycetales bacterium]|jgi:RNA polymerase sigma-70 factor (ECF subfamily)|nr:sigma-70 family RNA polymerase sigma factor [Planctomycetales bacterium]
MSDTPASLLERLRDPDAEEAWVRFVELYSPLLLYWARRVGLREPDASDLVQDVFVVLLRKLPEFRYDAQKGFRNWLRTVTLNRWREIRRRQQHPATVGADTLNEVPDSAVEEPFWEVEYRQQLARRLLEVMRQEFEPATWQACWECVVNGRPAADVGKELGISPGAVRMAKFRVLSRLRRELDGLLE